MARCQRQELLASVKEERVGADDERGVQLDEHWESGVDLTFGAGLQDMDLQSLRARRFLHVSNGLLGTRVVRVHKHGDHGLRYQLGQQLEPLGMELNSHVAEAGKVAGGVG